MLPHGARIDLGRLILGAVHGGFSLREASHSRSGAVPIAVLVSKPDPCSASEFQVVTYNAMSPSSPAEEIAFAIVAP